MPPGRPRKNQQDVLIKSAELIGWAIGGIEREISQTRDRLAALTAQAAKLRARAGMKASPAGAATATADEGVKPSRKRRRSGMSPEARARMSEMMKKRWAEKRKGKELQDEPRAKATLRGLFVGQVRRRDILHRHAQRLEYCDIGGCQPAANHSREQLSEFADDVRAVERTL